MITTTYVGIAARKGTQPQVLRGSARTVLRQEGDVLVLERAGEVLTIPLRAVAVVRTEGRSVAAELLAPKGAPAASYRIEDVLNRRP
ncbi:hypothetical protein [Streptomyces sp. NPDC002825]|uniref:hypothetical protein n=1 Tax=Streptomyces sp. NPDC002825 TaxID=3154666 RepID=UPI0033173142